MQPFSRVRSIAAALPRANVDTEVIIPISRIIAHPREKLGPFCFDPWRTRADGSPNPEFELNDPRFSGAQILVAGENFGCGSSREHAVWALWGMGFRCIIAPSFGDIFRSNCFQIGLLPITLGAPLVAQLIAEIGALPIPECSVDLAENQIVSPRGQVLDFAIDAQRRLALLEGLDEIGLTLRLAADIDTFQARDRTARPWAYPNI